MEEGRLPLGIPSTEDVNRGKGAYSKRDIQTQATQLEFRVFHFGQDCISTASIESEKLGSVLTILILR